MLANQREVGLVELEAWKLRLHKSFKIRSVPLLILPGGPDRLAPVGAELLLFLVELHPLVIINERNVVPFIKLRKKHAVVLKVGPLLADGLLGLLR